MSRDKNWLNDLKATYRCIECGSNINIHFHHTNSDSKILPVSELNRKYGKAKVLAEIAKCVPLCGNCHDTYHNGVYHDRRLCRYGAKCCPLIGTPECKCAE